MMILLFCRLLGYFQMFINSINICFSFILSFFILGLKFFLVESNHSLYNWKYVTQSVRTYLYFRRI